VRRYLSLLDAAVELEFRDYSGPRLDPRYRVLMFEHALTADEANRKYRSAAGERRAGERGWERGGRWPDPATCPPPGSSVASLGARHTFSQFPGGTKLGGVVDTPAAVLPFSETWTGWRVGQRGT